MSTKEKLSQDFIEMDIMMGSNPNYGDIKKLTYNRRTGQLEDNVIVCPHCGEVTLPSKDICPTCKKTLK